MSWKLYCSFDPCHSHNKMTGVITAHLSIKRYISSYYVGTMNEIPLFFHCDFSRKYIGWGRGNESESGING